MKKTLIMIVCAVFALCTLQFMTPIFASAEETVIVASPEGQDQDTDEGSFAGGEEITPLPDDESDDMLFPDDDADETEEDDQE